MVLILFITSDKIFIFLFSTATDRIHEVIPFGLKGLRKLGTFITQRTRIPWIARAQSAKLEPKKKGKKDGGEKSDKGVPVTLEFDRVIVCEAFCASFALFRFPR